MTAASMERPRRTTLEVGEVLAEAASGGRFQVTGFVGKGGMGEVYLGRALETGGVVAIKTIPLALADDPKVALRTQFESMALRTLRHRHVVPVYASGVRADGVIFMVMEYLRGMTLAELRRTKGRIPIPWALEMVRDVCEGLDAIHAHAVHRDVKPANLHFGVDAVVRVLDLGAAKWKRSGLKLTSTGTQLGTLAYMAPEQLDESAPIEAQADLWSAGVVLYELLADRHPFAFDGRLPDNPFMLGERILDRLHVPLRDVAPRCPGYLAQIVDKMLAKHPRDRYRTAAEAADVISAAMESFAREHGEAPPLAELAAQTFPDAPRPVVTKPLGRVHRAPQHLVSTAPLDPGATRAQPAALPYLRTAEMPASVAAASPAEAAPPRVVVAPPAVAPALPSPSLPSPSLPPPEREPPRVSDVFLKEAPRREVPAPAPAALTVPMAIAPPVPARRAGVPWAAIAAAGVLLVAAVLVAVGVSVWVHRDEGAPAASASAPRRGPAAPKAAPSASARPGR